MNKEDCYKTLNYYPVSHYIKMLCYKDNLDIDRLSIRLNMTKSAVNDLLHDNGALTKNIANRLENTFNISSTTWLNLEKSYIDYQSYLLRTKDLKESNKILKLVDFDYFSRLGLYCRKGYEPSDEVAKFFKIASLTVLKNKKFLFDISTNESRYFDIKLVNTKLWIAHIINIGNLKKLKYNEEILLRQIQRFNSLTTNDKETLVEFFEKSLEDSGVTLVSLPKLQCNILESCFISSNTTRIVGIDENYISKRHIKNYISNIFNQIIKDVTYLKVIPRNKNIIENIHF